MDSQNKRVPTLIIGATGRLGSLITKHCLAQPKLLVSVLIRNPEKNKELVESVEKAGGKVWKGDVTQLETLYAPLKGIHTVVSATNQFDKAIALDGQFSLIDAAVRNGVKRFSPSDYASNMTKISPQEFQELGVIEYKFKVLEYLKTKPIKTIHFYPGLFIDSFFDINAEDFGYWGNVDHCYDLTSYEDTARYVAAALIDENGTGSYNLSVNRVTINQAAEIYNKVRGTQVAPKYRGTYEDLRNAYNEGKKTDPTALSTLLLSIYLLIFDDRSTFDKVHNNEFPGVKTTSIKEFLGQNPNVKLPGPTK